MKKQISSNNQHARKTYIITGPTSGISHATALELAKRAMGEL
jgi:NAD(P)-dependent dehydrogenase (short-subunit alcohol dehydrogenase family)